MKAQIKQRIRHQTAALLILIFTLTGTVPAFAEAVRLIPVDVSLLTNTVDFETTEVEVSWSDDWFAAPSTEYNHELAVTSIALSDLAYLEGYYAVHSDSDMRRVLIDLGFDEGSIFFYNYDYPFTVDNNDIVAFTLATKYTENGIIVAVIIRGTMDTLEWDSDIRVSANPADFDNAVEHYGFYQAERKLADDLSGYITAILDSNEANKLENMKFYVTGHSRGGSVADILASELDDLYGKDRVYAYTFAAPAVAVRAGQEGYENIFNIISGDDQISQLPFSKFDFKRFGVDLFMISTADPEGPSEATEVVSAHDAFVYYERMKYGYPDTLFE